MTRTQIGILWGTTLLVVIGLVVLSQVLGRPTSSTMTVEPTTMPAAVYRLPESPGSARSLYAYADQAARTWQADAQLASALSNWAFVEIDDLSQPAPWTYQFYSPATGRACTVSVDGTQATVIRESLSPYPLRPVTGEAWRVDSPQALSAWLEQGGGAFLSRHSVVDLSARLRVSEQGRLEWVVVGMVRDTETMQLVRIDAATGAVLQ
ncbi:MAG: hypothetical protein ACK2VA_06825 [Anaerolineae bacterium]